MKAEQRIGRSRINRIRPTKQQNYFVYRHVPMDMTDLDNETGKYLNNNFTIYKPISIPCLFIPDAIICKSL
jgi:hypothetical protein